MCETVVIRTFESLCVCVFVCCVRPNANSKSTYTPKLKLIEINLVAVCLFNEIRNWFVRWITGTSAQSADNEFDFGSDDEDEQEDREEKKTIKERLQTIQEVSQSVQNTIGRIASLGESVKK